MIDGILKKVGLDLRIDRDAGPIVIFARVPSWMGSRHAHPENCEAPLDLGYCCTTASMRGFVPVLLDLETGLVTPSDLIETVRSLGPGAVFINGITPAVPAMLDIASKVRAAAPGSLVVAVGQHADYSPGTFLFPGSPVSLAAVGEFEETVGEIMAALRDGLDPRVAGTRSMEGTNLITHGTRPLITDLDGLGMPDHRFFLSPVYRYLHPMRTPVRRRWGFIQASRGCPFSCIYCSKTLRTSFGPAIRNRSPESVVAEMRWLNRHGVNTVVFTDDLFNSSKERVMTLCDAILSSGLKMGWTAEGRVKPTDPEMFRMMRRAGCSTFSMGVESGSPTVLRTLDKKATVAEAERAFAHAREAGLLRVAFFMVGCPGETRYDFEMTRALLRRIRPEMIQVANFTAYPGSRAYESYMKKMNLPWERFQHYERLTNLSAESDEMVRQWQKTLYIDLLTSGDFAFRYLIKQNLGMLLNLDREISFAVKAARKLLQ